MSNTDEIISVIVPIYNVEQYLNECIQSIVDQTYKNLEIILVDDGSPDRCGSICDEWAKKDNRIKVIHKTNGGLSDARNAGIAEATGDYIAFVDSDDWIAPKMYETMLSALEIEKADLVACGIVYVYPDHVMRHSTSYEAGTPVKFLKKIYQDTTFPVAAWNKLYRRKIWNDFRFPKGKICEDAFTAYFLVDKASRIVQIPDGLYNYRIRESSIMTSEFRPARMDEEEAWRQNYQYMKRKHPEIAKAAFDFYLQKVNVLIHIISDDQKEKYRIEYNKLYRILSDNVKYVLFESDLSVKYRIRFLLDFMKLKRYEYD